MILVRKIWILFKIELTLQRKMPPEGEQLQISGPFVYRLGREIFIL